MPGALGADHDESGQVVSVVRRIAAPPDIVFGYLVDPLRFVQWMGVRAECGFRANPITDSGGIRSVIPGNPITLES